MLSSYRLQWIDAAKGFGISLVVFGHVWRGLKSSEILDSERIFLPIDNAIYLFHMPLFFVLSGMLFEKTILRYGVFGSLFRRVETLIYPLVLWSYISALSLFVAGSLTNRGGVSLEEVALYPFPPKDVYWFLAALFVIQCFASIIIATRAKAIYWVGLMGSSLMVILIDLESWPFWIRSTIENAPLFLIGILLSGWTPNKWQAFSGLALFLCAEIWAVTRTETLLAPLDFLPGVVATVGLLAFMAMSFSKQNSLVRCAAFVGRASMTIYVSHIITLAGTRIALAKIGVDDVFVHLACGTAAGLLLPLAFHQTLRLTHTLRLFGLGRDVSQSSNR